MENVRLSPSDFIALTNQTLEYAYPSVEIEGEIQGFKVNQNKYVFFDVKDENASLGCFMTVWQMRTPLEDGMKVIVTATPKLTNWGKFSLTIKQIALVGEGSIKRSFELLVAKLRREGLFEEDRKRLLPDKPHHIGVIASTDSAAYADFIKIINERWGGLRIDVAHVQVQGVGASEQIVRALQYFNQSSEPPEVIAIMRGGGSLDDLSTFNDEPLTRAVASSRVPTITGIGHETDTSLVDMVADTRAATPSNVAQILVPDKREIIANVEHGLKTVVLRIGHRVENINLVVDQQKKLMTRRIMTKFDETWQSFFLFRRTLSHLNPQTVLQKGYAIARYRNGRIVDANVKVGDALSVETDSSIMKVEVYDVKRRKK